MGVCHQNMADLFSFGCQQQGIDVGIVCGAGINDRNLATADNIGTRTGVGKRPWITGDNSTDQR